MSSSMAMVWYCEGMGRGGVVEVLDTDRIGPVRGVTARLLAPRAKVPAGVAGSRWGVAAPVERNFTASRRHAFVWFDTAPSCDFRDPAGEPIFTGSEKQEDQVPIHSVGGEVPLDIAHLALVGEVDTYQHM